MLMNILLLGKEVDELQPAKSSKPEEENARVFDEIVKKSMGVM